MNTEELEDRVRNVLHTRRATAVVARGDVIVDNILKQRSTPRRARWPFALLAGAAAMTAVLLTFQVLDNQEHHKSAVTAPTYSPSAEASAPRLADCFSGLVFKEARYTMVMGSAVNSVPLGDPAGRGTIEACAENPEDAGAARPVDVFELPGVPISQALLVKDPDGRGTLYIPENLPAATQAPALTELLREMGVAQR